MKKSKNCKMKFLYIILIFSIFNNFIFTQNFLECQESDTGKDWKEKKLLQTNFYIFSENDFKLFGSENEFKKGSYLFKSDYGQFSGPYAYASSLEFIPIENTALKKRSMCRGNNSFRDRAIRSCNNHFAQIDRSTLEIQKYYMSGVEGTFFSNLGNERNKWQVTGTCKILDEEEFFNKTLKTVENKVKKNKI